MSPESQGQDDMESTQFLEIFQPFTTVRSLYVSKTLVPFIAPALQELLGESATEVLPNPRDLSLGGSVISGSMQEDIQPFTEARRLSGQPVAVHHWRESGHGIGDSSVPYAFRISNALSTCTCTSVGSRKRAMEFQADVALNGVVWPIHERPIASRKHSRAEDEESWRIFCSDSRAG
ncbi:hypothetical protein BC826DRAFT_1102934 [Russula brevipes]|nr:hypothetical protein BC826DRAFT_1102934 [Russula brevipes]